MELTPRGDEKAKSSPDAMPVVASAFSVSSAAQGLLLWFLALRSASQASNHPWLEVLDMIFLYLQGSRSLEARARAEIQHHLCAGPPLSVRCLDRELMPPMPVNYICRVWIMWMCSRSAEMRENFFRMVSYLASRAVLGFSVLGRH